jgi:hypothetical protein
MRRVRHAHETSFEDVELESGWLLAMLDSSTPLVIDTPPHLSFKFLLLVIAAEVLVVLSISIRGPKDHFVE